MEKFRIRDIELANNIIVGPMAGISNLGYRQMIKQFDPGLIYSEMVSDKAITYKSKKTLLMTRVLEEERPMTLQLFGNETESMVEAAKYLDKMTDCDIIDINMGCPVPKIVNNHSGSALMKEPEKAFELVKNIVENVDKPVTVKLRAGWDKEHINVVEMAVGLEKSGVSAICVHPRTKTEFYAGHSNWDLIRQLVSTRKDARILNMFAYTGAATMTAAAAGAEEVVHLDASKGINEWAKENMKLSHLEDRRIRFIVDDALKFMERELRRGRRYDGIIMDPPSYGRGPDNQLFKFEEQINPLIGTALKLLSDDPLFLIINTYTTGYSPAVMYNVLNQHLQDLPFQGVIEADEIGIRLKDSDLFLPCGQTTRWHR